MAAQSKNSNGRTLRAKNAAEATKTRKQNTHLTPDQWGRLFFAEYGETYSIRKAAMKAGVSVDTVYKRIPRDPEFAATLEAMKAIVAARVDEEIYHRAIEGDITIEPIFFKGANNEEDGMPIVAQVGSKVIVKKSDQLLTLLAKSLMPEKYGDRVTVYNIDISSEIRKVATEQNVPAEIVAGQLNESVRRLMKEQGDEDKRRFLAKKTG